jgi:hypothetical protein
MGGERAASFDPTTVAMLKNVLEDAWSRLPPGQTEVTRSLLAERIFEGGKGGRAQSDASPSTRNRRGGRSQAVIGRVLAGLQFFA